MDVEKSWTNPAFQADEFGVPPVSSRVANYQGPSSNKDTTVKKEDLRSQTHKLLFNKASEETWKGPGPPGPFPHESRPPGPFPPDSRPPGRIGEQHSSTRPQFEEKANPTEYKEDYSLRSYFKDLSWYNELESRFVVLTKGTNLKKLFKTFLSVLLFFLNITYFVAVLVIRSEIQERDYWCNGDGFLIIVNFIVLGSISYFQFFKPVVGRRIYNILKSFCEKNSYFQKAKHYSEQWYVKLSVYAIVIGSIVIFLIVDSGRDRSRLVSLFGIFVLIFFGFLFSVAPKKVIWRQVIWGIVLQFILGLILLRWPTGRVAFLCLGDKVRTFLQFTNIGSEFVFGSLVSELHILAFEVLTTIFFFGFWIQILYYYGAMQWIVLKLGWFLQVTIGTTACESVTAAANIFIGQSEAPLLIKPFLSQMTNSELHAVLAGGFATATGTMLAVYIAFEVDPAHLLTASVMSAPAALGFSKLFYPETEISKTTAKNINLKKGTEENVLHAACEGVLNAIPLVANITANLVAFLAFMGFADAVLNWGCMLLNAEDGTCSLSSIFGYLFMPLAFIMGVPWQDCYYIGQLIGTKTFINEFLAYLKLVEYRKSNAVSKRSEIIATYALCGFSNVPGIGIQLGAFGAMVPDRFRDIAQIAVRSMIAGSIACFLTACVAGTLIQVDETTLGSLSNTTTNAI